MFRSSFITAVCLILVNNDCSVLSHSSGDSSSMARTCFGIPSGCCKNDGVQCKVKATFSPVVIRNEIGRYNIELEGEASSDSRRYIALGISGDKTMGADSVIGCYVDGGHVKLEEFYNIPRQNWTSGNQKCVPVEREQNKTVIHMPQTSISNGRLNCKFYLDTEVSLEKELNLVYNLSMPNYVLLAAGDLKKNGLFGYHEVRESYTERIVLSAKSQVENATSSVSTVEGNERTIDVQNDSTDTNNTSVSKEEGCYGVPDGCCATKSCKIMVVYGSRVGAGHNAGVNIHLEGEAKPGEDVYIAMGISDDHIMGSDSVFACYNHAERVVVNEFYNIPRNTFRNGVQKTVQVSSREPNTTVIQDPSGSINNGRLSCKFTLRPVIEVKELNVTYNLNESAIILLATGPMKGQDLLGYHASTKWGSSKRITLAGEANEPKPNGDDLVDNTTPVSESASARTGLNPKSNESETKGSCFGLPSGCCATKTCSIMAQFGAKLESEKTVGIKLHLEGNAKLGDSYVAAAFSNDSRMGSDSVFACYSEGGRLVVGEFYNIARSGWVPGNQKNSPVVRDTGNKVILNSEGGIKDGRISCDITIKPLVDLKAELNVVYDLKESVNILLATGNMKKTGILGYHDLRGGSDDKLLLVQGG